jgi:hypothetical protein
MKVSGFTFVRNAIRYDYPVVEAIQSVLPLCTEMVVAVGNSDDDTLELIRSIPSDKIRIIETVWDDNVRDNGRVLALETDKAFRAIDPAADWAFYIQADEVMHEKYIDAVRENMQRYKDDPDVEGLLFDYVHFYGSYDYVGTSYRWYRREVRVIRNRKDIFSYRDAQGFRILPNRKLKVKHIPAAIFHYGYVREPKAMQNKQMSFNRYWHSDEWIDQNIPRISEFDYSEIDRLEKFQDTHPQVMRRRIANLTWNFEFDERRIRLSLKDRVKEWVEKTTGRRLGEYRNYKIV